jgi:hypothetical protein
MSKNIIQKEGRIPYDANKRRLALAPYEQRDQAADYISWQSKINIEENGTINDEILQDYLDDHNYKEIIPSKIDKLAPGARIAYITKTNKWRSGGFYIRTEESKEDADGNKFKKAKKYVLYKSFNNSVFPVQVEDVEMFYTKERKKDIIIKKQIVFKRPEKVTNFPVFLTNRDGEEVAVYYARDSNERRAIVQRTKYKEAVEDPEWEFDDGTWE